MWGSTSARYQYFNAGLVKSTADTLDIGLIKLYCVVLGKPVEVFSIFVSFQLQVL